MLKKKNILVTGGAGFIGTNLIYRLNQINGKNSNIICVDNLYSGNKSNLKPIFSDNFRFLNHNINSPTFIDKILREELKIHEIYHLACPASPPVYQKDPIFTLRTCFEGTKNVLDLAEKFKAKILFSSTSEVYGNPLVHPQTETYNGNVNPVGPRSCYDEGKRVAETLCYEYFNHAKANVKIVRIFNTYGPFMDPNDGRVVSNIITQVLNKKDITLYGDGKQSRSFCYVDDLVDGLIKYMELDEKFLGPINLGNPHEISVNDLAGKIKDITNSKSKIIYKKLPKDDPTRRRPNNTLAHLKLGWYPIINIEEGLEKTIRYFRNYFDE